MDVIVLINPALRWLVPDHVGGVWVVDQSIDANSHWNEGLDIAVKAHAEKLGLNIFVPITFQSLARLSRFDVDWRVAHAW